MVMAECVCNQQDVRQQQTKQQRWQPKRVQAPREGRSKCHRLTDMSMAEAGEASSMACKVSGKTTCVHFMAPSQQWERNKNGKRLRSEIQESSSAPGDWKT